MTEAHFVVRTLRALDLAALGARSTREFAEGLQIHPRTARRMLARLCDEGFLVRTDKRRGRYELTMHLVSLGARAATRAELLNTAGPILERLLLVGGQGVTARLAVPCYDSIVWVMHRGPVTERSARMLAPCHCTAAGKALLAARPAWREDVLAGPLARFTACTQTDREALRAELLRVEANGYAVEDREHEQDVRSVAAPVRSVHGDAVAALAVIATRDLDIPVAAASLVDAAGRLSRLQPGCLS
jgi:IclR family acetate operon transcriptional repressor